jgi:hypothetical protein
MRRIAIRIALALVAFAGSSEPVRAAGAAGAGTRAFRAEGISFRYPTAWHVSPPAWRWSASFSRLVTYLSVGKLHDPCAHTETTTTCSTPIAVLAPGNVLVTWTRGSLPTWRLARQPGRATTLAGRPARVQIARPGACGALGASETVTAQIAVGPRGDSLQMQACLRGANAALNERRALAMLASLRLT